MEGGPEAVAGAAEVVADGGGVEAGVDAGEEDDEVFGDEIRDELVVRGEELGFGGFPRGGQCPIHRDESRGGTSFPAHFPNDLQFDRRTERKARAADDEAEETVSSPRTSPLE